MFVVWNLSYAACESRVVEFRIVNLWIFDTSDLQWPETIQVTVGRTLILGYHGCSDFSHEYVVVSFVLDTTKGQRKSRISERSGICFSCPTRQTHYALSFGTLVATGDQCQVVWKLVNANPGLKVYFSCIKMFFTASVLCSLRLFKLKTKGQTI